MTNAISVAIVMRAARDLESADAEHDEHGQLQRDAGDRHDECGRAGDLEALVTGAERVGLDGRDLALGRVRCANGADGADRAGDARAKLADLGLLRLAGDANPAGQPADTDDGCADHDHRDSRSRSGSMNTIAMSEPRNCSAPPIELTRPWVMTA